MTAYEVNVSISIPGREIEHACEQAAERIARLGWAKTGTHLVRRLKAIIE